jgi:putative N6-adenine-specific DNA methylase
VREKDGVISINTSGAPLFQRGYRQSTGDAPLNEVVAAGLVRMSGWDRKSTLIDPFCGSGTILIEAALLASGIPSNIERTHYAFKHLKNFNDSEWNLIYDKAIKSVKELPCELYGSDIDPAVLMKAKRNARGFSFGRFIQFQVEDFADLQIPKGPGMLITNPPYGERLSTDVEELYETIGSVMKHKMQGYTCWIISSSESGFKSIGLRPERKIKLFNGDLECSFRKYTIYEGSKKDKQQETTE